MNLIALMKKYYRRFKSFYYRRRIPKVGDGPQKILVINHFFDQDIEALIRANDGRFTFYIVDPEKLFAPIVWLFPEKIRKARIPYNSSKIHKYRKRSRKWSEKLFEFLRDQYEFKAIVTPSDLFYWLREFINVVQDNDIPTIVIDKEGTISPYYFDNHAEDIKRLFPFISDHLIVWSKRQKKFWINAGVDKSKISILGQARSDLLHYLEPKELNLFKNSSAPLILFFTYELDAYIPNRFFVDGKLSWEVLREYSHTIIKKTANNNRNINFIVKCHPQQSDVENVKREFAGYENVKVLTGAASSNQLLKNADLVIGFQTTALIEAVSIDKPVVYTFFTEDVEQFKNGILPFHRYDIFHKVESPKELESTIEKFIKSDFNHEIDIDSKNRLLEEYLLNPDGSVSERILRFLDDYISGYDE